MPITQVVPTLIVLFGMAIALLFGHTAEFPRYQEAVRAVAVDLSISHAEERHGEAARRLSEQYNQIGMFHLGGQGFIPTAGSGERIDTLPPRSDRLKR